MADDFASAKAYLESLIPKEREDYNKIGLNRIRALLSEMGNPQDSYPTIHVGGTAGKGSTATMIASIMQKAGYKTGLHVSPHLEDIRERMEVNGAIPTDDEFVDLVNSVKASISKVKRWKYGKPSYFEVLLAITFERFRRENVDVAIIEVGMGGRLDGTNVITPKVAVLTNVGWDHMEYLGDTLEKIATEKVGIFKKGIDVITGVTQPPLLDLAEKKARSLGCKVDLLGRDIKCSRMRHAKNGFQFNLAIRATRYKDLSLSLLGQYQVENAALAIDAALKMNKHGFSIGEKDVRSALSKISVPCRFEILRERPLVILDGAHNPMKIDALIGALRDSYPGRHIIFLFAAKNDKRVGEMIGKLSPMATKFYFTTFASTTDFGKRMSYDADELDTFTYVNSEVIPDAIKAYRRALAFAGKDEIVCVTGSLYLTGEIRSHILR